MSPPPTGHLRGDDLILTRTFHASIDDVWISVTDPQSTARWIGPWEGDAGPGKTVRLQMVHEQGAPWCDVTIEVCDAPHHLAVQTRDSAGAWRLELLLEENDGTTSLRLVHHLSDRALAEHAGPGWEYYLDMLVAARAGAPLPRFDDYYPGQRAYYAAAAT